MEMGGSVVEDFQRITSTDAEYARMMLQKSDGILEIALTEHFNLMDSLGVDKSSADDVGVVEHGTVAAGSSGASGGAPVEIESRMDISDSPRMRPAPAPMSVSGTQRDPARVRRRSTAPEELEDAAFVSPALSNGGAEASNGPQRARAPDDLTFTGTFEMAMDYANKSGKWLLVNIQDPDDAQGLNRDLWSNDAIVSVIQGRFVFWQRDRRSPEGMLFEAQYPLQAVPYVVIINPRTGEKLLELSDGTAKLERGDFVTQIFDFISSSDTDQAPAAGPPAPVNPTGDIPIPIDFVRPASGDSLGNGQSDPQSDPQRHMDPFREQTNGSRAEPPASPLEALFRPPAELIFSGNLDAAMEYASKRSNWLLINIQAADEFQCQILNRDLWKNDAIKSVIQSHFVFWQRDRGSQDGQTFHARYMASGNVAVPYVVLVDPRSGEKVLELTDGARQLDVELFLTKILDFLSSCDINDPSRPPATGSKPSPRIDQERASSSREMSGEDPESQVLLDEQLARAINASMEDNAGPVVQESSARVMSRLQSESNPELQTRRSVRETQDLEYEMSLAADRAREESMRLEAERQQREQQEREEQERKVAEQKERKMDQVPEEPAPGTAGATSLAIRMPDGSRLSRRFMATNTVGDVRNFVEAKTGLAPAQYELMTQFPRKVFADMEPTLKDVGLTPNASLIVHEL